MGVLSRRLAARLQGEEMRLAQERDRERERNLENCFDAAYVKYDAAWEKGCQDRRLGKDCALPIDAANRRGRQYREAQELCLKTYK